MHRPIQPLYYSLVMFVVCFSGSSSRILSNSREQRYFKQLRIEKLI